MYRKDLFLASLDPFSWSNGLFKIVKIDESLYQVFVRPKNPAYDGWVFHSERISFSGPYGVLIGFCEDESRAA